MALHEVLIYVCWTQYKIMLFVYAWVLIEPHHQAFAYLQMNLLYTYDAKNCLYNIVWNFQLPVITQRTILFLIVNLKDLLSSNPNRSRLWAFDCSRSYKPLDLRKRMSCTAQSHLNHHGFLNDLRLTSACTLLAKNLPLRKYFAQNIMRYVISIKTTANSIQMGLWMVIK